MVINMNIYDVIRKKRDGLELTEEEINYFVKEYSKGNIPDYQASALLMAIFINEMSEKETLYLTRAMVESGQTVDLAKIKGIKVDKHSTGGVGDTTTLILGPMVAACGVPFVKMSGRGLGHTGGTLDKLEAIGGFRVDLEEEEFINIANQSNIAICSQTANITPADKKIYALRDVTATVDNISLIASSIMSKKLAIKSDGIILDVKVGSGAFMKELPKARRLAEEMVKIGNNYGRKTIAVITNMDQPLGQAVGNALEIKEAIMVLKGEGPKDLLELCLILGSKLLLMAGRTNSEKQARSLLIDTIKTGKAYEKFLEFVKLQYGDTEAVRHMDLLPKAQYVIEADSLYSGYVHSLNAEEIGKCALELGAGRKTLESKLDMAAGLVLEKKVGDYVKQGEPLAYIHTNDMEKGLYIKKRLQEIYEIKEKTISKPKLIFDEI